MPPPPCSNRADLLHCSALFTVNTRYTLGYVESVLGAKRGERVLQVGVGSGVKCSVSVWRALRDVRDVQPAWEQRLSAEEVQQASRSAVSLSQRMRSVHRMNVASNMVLFVFLAAIVVFIAAGYELLPMP
jgi:hypothetical protein